MKEGKQLHFIQKKINEDEIACLRISDFNTTGLVGIQDDENDSPFYLLTKGSGTSGKAEGNGGSKGLGKYACFVASNLNTVFYSTKAYNEEKKREEIGYIGIAKLRSRFLHNDKRPNLMTMGTGYYAANEDNAPFHEELNLDPGFKRTAKEYGTDVFLLGYNSKDWKVNITYKVLEGFMAAVIFEGFEVEVDDIKINKDTISTIINSDLFDKKSSNEIRYLKAQYSLFSEEGVQRKEFIIGENNKITIYVRSYSQKNASEASKRVEFIRYPYMRIKKKSIQTFLPYSAMCIIEKNSLCEMLRKVEDPAHTDWEFNRLKKYDNDEEKKTRDLYHEMEQTIRNYIGECLQPNNGEQVDFEGAGEFLPSDEETTGEGGDAKSAEAVSITPVRRVVVNVPKTQKTSDTGIGPQFSTGNPEGTEEGVSFPKKGGDSMPNTSTKLPPDDERHGDTKGEQPAIIRVPLGGMRYRTIYNKNRQMDIIFTSKFTRNNCELELKEVGLKDDRYDVNILKASINGNPCEVKDGKIINLKIEEGQKIKISCILDIDERFASEVILNAIGQ